MSHLPVPTLPFTSGDVRRSKKHIPLQQDGQRPALLLLHAAVPAALDQHSLVSDNQLGLTTGIVI
jgi:hypothetical protein